MNCHFCGVEIHGWSFTPPQGSEQEPPIVFHPGCLAHRDDVRHNETSMSGIRLSWRHDLHSTWTCEDQWTVYKTFDRDEYVVRHGVGVGSLRRKVAAFPTLEMATTFVETIVHTVMRDGTPLSPLEVR
jgi:hypothetical protein